MYDFSTGQAVFSHLGTPDRRHGRAVQRHPAFTLTGPSAGTFTAGQSVTIGWTAANVDVAGPSKITLGYDPDTTAFDANQQWIEVDRVTAANGAASYSWNTAGVASGTYYLSGYMYDFATGKAVYSHLATPIVITRRPARPPLRSAAPAAGTFTAGAERDDPMDGGQRRRGGAHQDQPGLRPGHHALRRQPALDRGRRGTAANGAGSYSWNTAGVAAGTYYLSGYMYDFATGQAVLLPPRYARS